MRFYLALGIVGIVLTAIVLFTPFVLSDDLERTESGACANCHSSKFRSDTPTLVDFR